MTKSRYSQEQKKTFAEDSVRQGCDVVAKRAGVTLRAVWRWRKIYGFTTFPKTRTKINTLATKWDAKPTPPTTESKTPAEIRGQLQRRIELLKVELNTLLEVMAQLNSL